VKMLELRPARECEVVLAFLRAEVDASRYGQAVMQWLLATRFTRDELLENADLSDVRQNQARATILGRYRGFPDRLLFAGFPADAAWQRAEIEPKEMNRLRYARYKDWMVYSDNTRKPSRLIEKMRRGEIPSQDADRFRAIHYTIGQGKRFPELIAVEGQDDELILMEGHSRATAYIASDFSENVGLFVASSPSMHRWAFY